VHGLVVFCGLLLSVACLALPCFFLINGTIKKKSLSVKCGLWFSVQLLSEAFLILCKECK
jgi:hypothetical protein